jgi:cytochrome c2
MTAAIGWSSRLPVHAAAAGDPVKGREVYEAQGCATCHKIGDTGGPVGPDLSGVGLRRTSAWLNKYLLNTRVFDPLNKMPQPVIKGKELDDLIAYLLTLKSKKKSN